MVGLLPCLVFADVTGFSMCVCYSVALLCCSNAISHISVCVQAFVVVAVLNKSRLYDRLVVRHLLGFAYRDVICLRVYVYIVLCY